MISYYTILTGDVIEQLRTLPAGSVHCVVTSPPYWGLRDYGTATWEGGDPECDHKPGNRRRVGATTLGGGTNTTGHQAEGYRSACGKCGALRIDQQIGLEQTPAAYVARLVDVFREVRRVLRDDGTVWLNLGDSYASGKGTCYNPGGGPKSYIQEKERFPLDRGSVTSLRENGLKPKDLVGIPWRVAFALQDDGWWLRSEIIWAKRAPMPESVRDRPTRSHEQIFLLTKAARYCYDAEAVRETPADYERKGGSAPYTANGSVTHGIGSNSLHQMSGAGRNQRDVWLLGPEPYPEAHFAVFPTEIPRRAIKAGTSERGCCPACGAPWRRELEKHGQQPGRERNRGGRTDGYTLPAQWKNGNNPTITTTTGWEPTCTCGAPGDWRPDDLEIIASPTGGDGESDDPTMQTGRAGMNRPRGDCEGQRPITRYEQRHYADQLRQSARRADMATEAGSAFDHYTRTDKSGARAVPQDLLERWIERGWLERVTVPAWSPPDPVACTVLDPFGGSGTTVAVALELQRDGIMIDLNPEYVQLARRRISTVAPLLTAEVLP